MNEPSGLLNSAKAYSFPTLLMRATAPRTMRSASLGVAQASASALDEDKDVRSGVAKRAIDIAVLFRIRIFPRPRRSCLDRSSRSWAPVRYGKTPAVYLSSCSAGRMIHLSPDHIAVVESRARDSAAIDPYAVPASQIHKGGPSAARLRPKTPCFMRSSEPE